MTRPAGLFTNEHLALMVQRNVRSSQDLLALDGVGPSRVAKYGAAFLQILSSPPAPRAVGEEPVGET